MTLLTRITNGTVSNTEVERGTTIGQTMQLANNSGEAVDLVNSALVYYDEDPEPLLPGESIYLLWTGGIWRHAFRTHADTTTVEHNVEDYGADPTGVLDSADAFEDAIMAFSGTFPSTGGIVIVPPGTYRLSRTVHVKKQVWIKGSYGSSTIIKPDTGVTAFKFERYNTYTELGAAGSDSSAISDLIFYNANHKAEVWALNTPYVVGDVRKVGPAPGQGLIPFIDENEYYRHYVCTHAGTSKASGAGPYSRGNDKLLAYDAQSGNFHVGKTLVGATSGASGLILEDTDDGVTGTLRLTSVSGTFQDDEVINDYTIVINTATGGVLTSTISTGAAVANGTVTDPDDDELDGTARWEYIGAGAMLHIRANNISASNVTIQTCSGAGVHIVGGDLEDPNAFTNSNGWLLVNCNISTCDGPGLYIRGSDTNGGTMFGGSMGGCGGPASDEEFTGPGYCIYDHSYLGCTYVGVLFSTVGGQGYVHTASIGGAITFSGCYAEGTGGGPSVCCNGGVSIGHAMALVDWRSGAGPLWREPIIRTIGSSRSQNMSSSIRGYSAVPWRAGQAIPEGIQRSKGGQVYVAVQGGIAGVTGPTGTGDGQTDGTIIWDCVAATSPGDGASTLGSFDPTLQVVIAYQNPDDVGLGLGSSLKYVTTGASLNLGWQLQYGASGPKPSAVEGNGVAFDLATNNSYIPEWPMKIPAGKMAIDQFWSGGCRIQRSATTTDPDEGTWNPGDRMYYKGAACVSGGAEGKICTTAGTAGTYIGGRTATADGSSTILLSGAAMTTLIDGQDFKLGDWVTVGGSARRQVTAVSSDGLTLTLSSTVTAGAGKTMLFSAPTFKTFGSIS